MEDVSTIPEVSRTPAQPLEFIEKTMGAKNRSVSTIFEVSCIFVRTALKIHPSLRAGEAHRLEVSAMEDSPNTLEITDYLKRQIRFKARQVVGKAGLMDADRPDVEQELWLDLIKRWPKFRRDRARASTFVSRVLNHKLAMILRSRKIAKISSPPNGQSLDIPCRNEDGQTVSLAALLDEQVHRRRTGQSPPAIYDMLALKIDTAFILSLLDASERWLCQEMMRQSILEIARTENVSRTTVYRRVHQLRRWFERKGMRNYFGKMCTTRLQSE